MAPNPKFRRYQLAKIVQTPGNIENAVAFLALEMMVMPLVRAFVSRGLPRYLDRVDPAIVEKRAHRPINGRDTEPVDSPRCRLEQLTDA